MTFSVYKTQFEYLKVKINSARCKPVSHRDISQTSVASSQLHCFVLCIIVVDELVRKDGSILHLFNDVVFVVLIIL